jgi:acetoacetate decarboxylase
MLYDIDRAELDPLRKHPPNAAFFGAEVLWVRFETDPAMVRRCLPSGLAPTDAPLATAFVASYPETNLGIHYREGGLLLACRHKGEDGAYCLAMPVDDDTALIAGRERQGFPKKMADRITLEREGDTVVGSVLRKGTEILRIEAGLSGEATSSDIVSMLGSPSRDARGRAAHEILNFNYKFFPAADNRSFDYVPRLTRVPVLYRPRPDCETGKGTLRMRSSVFDHLGDIPVRKVVDILYGQFDAEILPGKTVGRAWNLLRFLPHAFFKTDIVAWLLDQRRTAQRRSASATHDATAG